MVANCYNEMHKINSHLLIARIYIIFIFTIKHINCYFIYVRFVLMNIVMTPIEWKFFQLHIIKKIALFVLVIGINILSIIFNSAIFGIIFVIFLFAISLLSYKKRFNNID